MELNYIQHTNEDWFDYVFRLVGLKLEDGADLDWEEIVRLTGLDVAADTLRKAMQPKVFGSYWVYKKLKETGVTAEQILQSTSLIPKSHLSRLKEATGDYNIRKRNMELERLELAKMMRVATPNVLLTEQFREYIEGIELKIQPYHVEKRKDIGNSVIKMFLSDIHIGSEIEEEYNTYNWEVLQKRTSKFIEKTEEYARLFNADTISLTIMGDIIEGFDMRNPQKWDCEFHSAEQIEKAIEYVLGVVDQLLADGFNVDLSGVYGNHDRLVGNKHDSIEEDNAVYVVMKTVKLHYDLLAKKGKIEKFRFIQSDMSFKYHIDEYFGVRGRYQHGDDDQIEDKTKISKYNDRDNDSYDYIVSGHIHHGRAVNRNRNTWDFYCGTIQGANEYGNNKIKSISDASQDIIIIRDTGEFFKITINLQ
jgi:UDP-2,3-diacylglucosamine pyrophosphatase LpxH